MKKILVSILTLGASSAYGLDASEHETPSHLRSKYDYLYKLDIQEQTNGSQKFHNGTLWRREGINILHLKGDRFEMAFQHGRLLKKETIAGAVTKAADMVFDQIDNAIARPFLNRLARTWARNQIIDPIFDSLNDHSDGRSKMLQVAWALHDTTGVPTQTFADGFVLGDSLLLLARKSDDMGKSLLTRGPNHCTSFAAWDDHTSSGEIVVGRNVDFPLNGYFDKFPTAIYYEPVEGQKYLSITSAGLHIGGLTAINESGIYIATHTIPTTDVAAEGRTIFWAGELIMQQAKTFDDVVGILESSPPPTGWTYFVVSSKERKIGTIEMSHNKLKVRMAEGTSHAQSNHFILPEMKTVHWDLSPVFNEDSVARRTRVKTNLAEFKGRIDTHEAARIMGDRFDPVAGMEAKVGNIVGSPVTIGTVIVKPESGQIFVANGVAPTSRGTFVELPVPSVFDPATFASDDYIVQPALAEDDAHVAEAFAAYITGKSSYEYDNDKVAALAAFKKAATLDSAESSYHLLAGLFALKVYDFEAARHAFGNLLAIQGRPRHKHLALYFRGRQFAHLGDRTRALRDYNALLRLEGVDPELILVTREEKLKISKRRRSKLNSGKISVLLQLPDVLSYP